MIVLGCRLIREAGESIENRRADFVMQGTRGVRLSWSPRIQAPGHCQSVVITGYLVTRSFSSYSELGN